MPVFIDVEASGFGSGSYPIEIGFIDGSGKPYCFLITPEPDWVHWTEEAQSKHQISRDTLIHSGKSVRSVATILNQLLNGATVYSDAWGYDNGWIARLYDAAGSYPSFKVQDLRMLLSEDEVNLWDQFKDKIIAAESVQRHRASNDARILQLTYVAVMGVIGSSNKQQLNS